MITSNAGLVAIIFTLVACSCATADPPASSFGAYHGPEATTKIVVLKGSPTIRLKFDREYSVLDMHDDPAAGPPVEDLRTWMLVPKDEQSSAVFGIGPGGNRKTEQIIADMYEGARVTRIPGTVAGSTVEWWHYKDSQHLYSTCYTSLADRRGVKHPVYLELVANSPERLSSLEKAFSGLELE